jgi:hypothetical protein
MSHQILPVSLIQGSLRLLISGELDKSEPSRSAGAIVKRQIHIPDFPVFFEEVAYVICANVRALSKSLRDYEL